jgi:glycosyltransferase involved in cell wall biosynthesis
MRILHAIPSVNPASGGPVEGLRQLARQFVRHGHHVEIVSLDQPEAPYLGALNIPVHPMGPGLFKYGFSKRLYPWLSANAETFDIVIVNGIWQYTSFAVWRALRGGKTPYVVFTHGMLDPWFKKYYPLKHLKKWLYWPWAEYRVLRDAKNVLFTCNEERTLARQSFWLYKANELVVRYGTTSPGIDARPQIAACMERFPELRGKRIGLFLGRIHEKKGCDLAIRAFAKVIGDDPDWFLVFAGPDQVGWQEKLEELAAELKVRDKVRWIGLTKGDVKWGLLRSAEFLFLPSHQENFGIVVAEALACGTPVLISDKVNIWREVEEHSAGLVARDDLAGAISLLSRWTAMGRSERLEMRARAKECFESQFEIERAAKSLIAVLEHAIGKRANVSPTLDGDAGDPFLTAANHDQAN